MTLEPTTPGPEPSGSHPGSGTSGGQPGGRRAMDEMRQQAGTIAEDVREMGRTARRAAGELYQDTRHEVTGAMHRADDRVVEYVQSQPYKALMIAGAVGLLFGLFWRR